MLFIYFWGLNFREILVFSVIGNEYDQYFWKKFFKRGVTIVLQVSLSKYSLIFGVLS